MLVAEEEEGWLELEDLFSCRDNSIAWHNESYLMQELDIPIRYAHCQLNKEGRGIQSNRLG